MAIVTSQPVGGEDDHVHWLSSIERVQVLRASQITQDWKRSSIAFTPISIQIPRYLGSHPSIETGRRMISCPGWPVGWR
jgi:hypothetical protein